MQTCPVCRSEWSDDAKKCKACKADLTIPDEPVVVTDADFDQRAERERFQAQYGVDIGDRTVDEYLDFIEQVDFSLSTWFWLVVGVEVAVAGLIAYAVLGPGGWELLPIVLTLSALLAAAIYADTAFVGLFERWSRTRWVYIGFALFPYLGQIAALIYILFRRLAREQAERDRRRLLESGFDV